MIQTFVCPEHGRFDMEHECPHGPLLGTRCPECDRFADTAPEYRADYRGPGLAARATAAWQAEAAEVERRHAEAERRRQEQADADRAKDLAHLRRVVVAVFGPEAATLPLELYGSEATIHIYTLDGVYVSSFGTHSNQLRHWRDCPECGGPCKPDVISTLAGLGERLTLPPLEESCGRCNRRQAEAAEAAAVARSLAADVPARAWGHEV